MMMTLESLPNETLIQCFQYLDAIELFYSFDCLNWRFFTLIRSISLHFDLGLLNNPKLTELSIKLSLNPQITERITSLTLQNKDLFDHIPNSSSIVSLEQLIKVNAAAFCDLDERSIDQFSSMLPLLPNLHYVFVDVLIKYADDILRLLSSSAVKRLVIKNYASSTSLDHSFMSLTHLTIGSCSINELCQFFAYLPILRYLSIEKLHSHFESSPQSQLPQDQLIHLERVIVNNLDGDFQILKTLAQRTPNLKFFILLSYDRPVIVDASHWRELIETSWSLLEVLKFVCHFRINDEQPSAIIDKLRLFQTEFWHDQHHWYVEYILNQNKVSVYTIPYVSHKYTITSNTKRYVHPLNRSNVFPKVTDLTLHTSAMNAIDRYYFPGVKLLILTDTHVDLNLDYFYLPYGQRSAGKIMASLPNLTTLGISSACRKASDPILLQLMDQNTQLSSLIISSTVLYRLLKNCQSYDWGKRIQNLRIIDNSWTRGFSSKWMMRICTIFCNMEQFRCKINETGILKIVIHHLCQLPYMRILRYETTNLKCIDGWLVDHSSIFESCSFKIHCYNRLQRFHCMDYSDSD